MEIFWIAITALLLGYVWNFVSANLPKYIPQNSVTQNKFVAVAITGAFIMLSVFATHFVVSIFHGGGGHHRKAV